MIFKTNEVSALINSMLIGFELNKSRYNFFVEIILLFLSIKDKMNFSQFGRYGAPCEQRYRQQFAKPYNFMNFNAKIVKTHASNHIVIGFDPSYISKSGKCTYGFGNYWSGVAGKAKPGLEISGIAAIDIDNNTALHLEAVQTPGKEELKELGFKQLSWYANCLTERSEILKGISKCVVADAYFSKKPFADQIIQAGMNLISRLRKDSDLKYLYKGKPTGKRGRPTKFAGKIKLKDIDKKYFEQIYNDDDKTVYTAIVYSKALKRNIKLIYEQIHNDQSESYLLFFSTQLDADAMEILKIYKTRFQSVCNIEFLYRDGKQFTGLNHCQARSKNKLHFHFNASLTAVNLAKAEYHLSVPKDQRGTFSMADIKTMHHNELLLKRFIKVYAVPAYKLINKNIG
ncbi:MAG: transposase [bacterium]|nr:transposase [bacterium]